MEMGCSVEERRMIIHTGNGRSSEAKLQGLTLISMFILTSILLVSPPALCLSGALYSCSKPSEQTQQDDHTHDEQNPKTWINRLGRFCLSGHCIRFLPYYIAN